MPNIDPITVIVLLPLLGAAAAFLLGSFAGSRGAGYAVALSLALGAFPLTAAFSAVRTGGAILTVAGDWAPSVGIHLVLDGVAWVMLVTFFFVAFLILIYSIGEGSFGAHFYAVYAVAVAGMAGVVLSADLFNLFVFFEGLSLSATVLIAYKRRLTGLYAAFRYLLITVVSVALYLLGLFMLYRESGELAFSLILPDGGSAAAGVVGSSSFAGILLFSGIAIRVALVPFHTWLPDAHGQAPHPVSALLSGLMIKAAFVALWRIVSLFSGDPRFMELLLIIGVVSALFGVILALAQSDAKRLLAYHSISQMGYIAAAAGAGALTGALYHAVGHALFKSLLFLVVGYYISLTGSRTLYRMRPADSAGALPPLLFLVGAGAIVGLPPFTGFVSKGLIGAAVKEPPAYWGLKLVALGTAGSFIKLAWFMLTAGRRASGPEGAGGAYVTGSGVSAPGVRSKAMMMVGMSGIALPVLLLGLFPARVLALLGRLRLSGSPEAPTDAYTLAAVLESIVILALGALLFAWLRSAGGKWIAFKIRAVRLGVDGSLAVIAFGVLAAFGLFLI